MTDIPEPLQQSILYIAKCYLLMLEEFRQGKIKKGYEYGLSYLETLLKLYTASAREPDPEFLHVLEHVIQQTQLAVKREDYVTLREYFQQVNVVLDQFAKPAVAYLKEQGLANE